VIVAHVLYPTVGGPVPYVTGKTIADIGWPLFTPPLFYYPIPLLTYCVSSYSPSYLMCNSPFHRVGNHAAMNSR
jgi:hypothetical protein